MEAAVEFEHLEDLALGGEEEDHPLGIVYAGGEGNGENDGGNDEVDVDNGENDGIGGENAGGNLGAGAGQQPQHRARRANTAAWAAQELPFDCPQFTAQVGPKLPDGQDFGDALAVFDLFWKPLREQLVIHTNCYAHRLLAQPGAVGDGYLRPWKEVSSAEMDVFMAILLFMGVKELPNERLYWSESKWGEPTVAKNMSRLRFSQIKRCLSVASPSAEQNAQDKLAKCRAAVDTFVKKAAQLYVPVQNLSLDESQILCCGRNARCAHRGDKHNIKPLKDYIKSFGLHESGTGYCVKFVIDERNATTTRQYVHQLVEPLVNLHQPYQVVTDRYYTSVDTARSLQAKGVFMFGTLRRDRGCPKQLLDNVKAHPLQDGEFRWRMAPSEPTPLSVYTWRDSDKNGTLFLSTCHKPSDTVEVRRRVRGGPDVIKPAPKCAADYNVHMGFCDSANHMKTSYAVQLTHHRRWYMCVIYYVLEMSVLNSLVIWRQRVGQPQLSHLAFRDTLIDSLLGRSSAYAGALLPPPAKRQRLDANRLPARRLTKEPHLIASGQKRNCKWCYAVSKTQSSAVYECVTCGVPLHPKCFQAYHTAAQP